MIYKKLILLVGLLLIIQSADAIGLAHGPLKHNFQPNGVIEVSFRVMGHNNIEDVKIDLDGALKPYATMTELDENHRFWITVNLPEYIAEPGDHKLNILVYEDSSSYGAVGTRTEIVNEIKVFVPFDGKYIRLNSFIARNIAVGEKGTFVAAIQNLGNTKIDATYMDVDIYDNSTDELVDSLRSNIISLDSFMSNSIEAVWVDTPESNGIYYAKATIYYDGQNVEAEDDFRVGELLVEIFGFSEELTKSKTQPFDITVESKWNSEVKDVYASVAINEVEFKSFPVDLPPWESQTMTAYVDTSELKVGELYPVEITIYYVGKTSTTSGEIEIIPSFFELDSTNLTYILIAAALIIIIYILHKTNINITFKKNK
ncbi:hypothetical protein HN924_03770 [Candidatus Woesearchaeota archaeon]|jgi:hypothetical protein|nr:hypothetical protein [Candidatus Woesearchaeota archaeon]MBT7063057.1 hypothetical protein [Candidatus Woesearchaeota archaeon]MBT7402229.1 hypothetical protein [Candidatus Woesearchaeota archaeon]